MVRERLREARESQKPESDKMGYAHEKVFKDNAELKDVTIRARGLHWEFDWAQGRRDAYYSEQLTRFSRDLIDTLWRRDIMAAGLIERMKLLRKLGMRLDNDTLESLLHFDFAVRLTETMLAAHKVLSRPTEVGTFGVVVPHDINSTLRDLVITKENCPYAEVTRVYAMAREAMDEL